MSPHCSDQTGSSNGLRKFETRERQKKEYNKVVFSQMMLSTNDVKEFSRPLQHSKDEGEISVRRVKYDERIEEKGSEGREHERVNGGGRWS